MLDVGNIRDRMTMPIADYMTEDLRKVMHHRMGVHRAKMAYFQRREMQTMITLEAMSQSHKEERKTLYEDMASNMFWQFMFIVIVLGVLS
jgi:hypothetical protein